MSIHEAGTHRHTTHEHEHEFEPERGLPEPLPANERVLWQGSPDWRVLARECFHVRKLAVYFGALAAWRIGAVAWSGADVLTILAAGGLALGLGAIALGFVTWVAWMSARTCVYTLTDRRVVMRVGIVLSVTFNLPFTKIESAGLQPLPHDFGDISLALEPGTRIAYPHLWPHARPWRVARTQPSLRCVAGAADVARMLTDAWRAARTGVATASSASSSASSSAASSSMLRPGISHPATLTQPRGAANLPALDSRVDIAQAA